MSEHSASLEYRYADESEAVVVADAIRQEVDEIADDRARATVAREGRLLRIEVTATDVVALRAGLNTWQTLVEVAEDAAAAGLGRNADGA